MTNNEQFLAETEYNIVNVKKKICCQGCWLLPAALPLQFRNSGSVGDFTAPAFLSLNGVPAFFLFLSSRAVSRNMRLCSWTYFRRGVEVESALGNQVDASNHRTTTHFSLSTLTLLLYDCSFVLAACDCKRDWKGSLTVSCRGKSEWL